MNRISFFREIEFEGARERERESERVFGREFNCL